MTNARGDDALYFLRTQAAFGAAEAAVDGAYFALPFYSLDLKPSEEVTEDDGIYGDRFPGDQISGLHNLAGSVVVGLGLSTIGHHLQGLFGVPVSTLLSAGKYQHVFTLNGAPTFPLHTMSITHQKVDTHFVQDSCVYTGLEMQAKKDGQRARASFNLLGRKEDKLGAVIDATPIVYATDPAPIGFQGKLKKGVADAAGVTGFSLNASSGVEMDQETINGTAYADAVDDGQWGLTGSLDARYRDNEWYDLGDNGTLVDLTLTYAVSADYSLEFLLHNLRIERSGVPINNRGIISSTFNFRAARPDAGKVPLTITLKNEVANYANPV